MSFSNRIRLPFKLHKPQFLEEADRYRKANGETVTLSVVVRKVYEGLTDSLPEKLHERLKIALVHDHVEVEGDKYVGIITQDGDYQIEWQDFLSHPLAQGKFKAEVTPFNATNSNCGTCEVVVQIVANDDNLGTLNESTHVIFDPLSNDEVCCNPVQISLVTVNGTFIENVVIDPSTHEIEFDVKSPIPAANDVVIITYRAQCDNGQYDEANVIATFNGSLPACLAPTNLQIVSVDATSVTVSWDDVAGAVEYLWQIREIADLSTIVQQNYTPVAGAAAVTLQAGTQYRMYVQTFCDDHLDPNPSTSTFSYIDFTTDAAPPSNTCGYYTLFNTDDSSYHQGSYTDCDGIFRGINIPPLHQRDICVLQSSPGVPVDLNVEPEISITYFGLC